LENDSLFWSWEYEGLIALEQVDAFEVPPEGLDLKAGNQMILSHLHTDSAGREDEAFLDGSVVEESGEPGGMARPICIAPYSEEWENNYPRE